MSRQDLTLSSVIMTAARNSFSIRIIIYNILQIYSSVLCSAAYTGQNTLYKNQKVTQIYQALLFEQNERFIAKYNFQAVNPCFIQQRILPP